MRRDVWRLPSQATGDWTVIAYGHYGRPLLAFPSDAGWAHDWEDRGMIDAIASLIEAGRVKVYCVDSYDRSSWRNDSLSLEDRARAHGKFEDLIAHDVVPAIYDDCGGPQDIIAAGVSFGAFHVANFCLKRADLFPLGLCFSGAYDMRSIGWGDAGDAFYFNNPMDYVANMSGDHLEWIRSRVDLLLVCGQGQWEDESASGALPSTLRFDAVLTDKGIRHETDLWGYDVPHDWSSWCRQIAHHLPRFV